MDQDQELKLQAFLDGELPEAEAREVANLVARDQAAAGLVAELRNTRQALAGFERPAQVPESREFYWSKIAREIGRQGAREAAPHSAPVPFMRRLQRLLAPLSALTAVLVLTTLSVFRAGGPAGDASTELEMSSDQMGALTYRSQTEGMTMVWLYDRDGSQFTDEASPGIVEPE